MEKERKARERGGKGREDREGEVEGDMVSRS